MLKNYILVALRQFSRHKLFTGLNIFCLTIGISFCMLMGQYILQERNINHNLKNIHQQYFITSEWKIKDTGPELTTIGPLAKALKQKYSDLVANYYRFNPLSTVVSAGEKNFKEDVSIGDTSLISIYGQPLLYEDPAHAFPNNSSAVITEDLALKLFGEVNAMGKTISLTKTTGTIKDYSVSAILKSVSYNSVHNLNSDNGYSMFIPFEGNDYCNGGSGEELWTGFFTVGFIELHSGVDLKRLGGPVRKLLGDNTQGAIARFLSILSFVALGILLLAVINFVNIMIGTSSWRIREIGLRKVFGGDVVNI